MMRQAQKMQQEMQEAIAQIKVDASVGGGAVTVQMDGQKNLLDLKISPEAAGDVEMLQDLVMSAVREGMRKVNEEIEQRVGSKMGGLGLPGLF
jgi:DNA-binding YbaB/EbfC family protein